MRIYDNPTAVLDSEGNEVTCWHVTRLGRVLFFVIGAAVRSALVAVPLFGIAWLVTR